MDVILENKIRLFAEKITPMMKNIDEGLINISNILRAHDVPSEKLDIVMNNTGSFVDKWGNNFSPIFTRTAHILPILKIKNPAREEKEQKLISRYFETIITKFDSPSDKPAFEGETIKDAMVRTFKDFNDGLKALKTEHTLPFIEIEQSMQQIGKNYRDLKTETDRFTKANKDKISKIALD